MIFIQKCYRVNAYIRKVWDKQLVDPDHSHQLTLALSLDTSSDAYVLTSTSFVRGSSKALLWLAVDDGHVCLPNRGLLGVWVDTHVANCWKFSVDYWSHLRLRPLGFLKCLMHTVLQLSMGKSFLPISLLDLLLQPWTTQKFTIVYTLWLFN